MVNFIYRVILFATVLTGIMLISVNTDYMTMTSVLMLAFAFLSLCFMCYKLFKPLSQEQINEILFINQLKKYGIDIDINED